MPLVLGTLIPSQPFGAQAVSGSISTSSVALGDTQTFNVAPEQRNVLDWLRAFNQGDSSTFDGQPADVIGFVYTEPSFDTNQFMVARFAISCCVADATAIGCPSSGIKRRRSSRGSGSKSKGRSASPHFRAIKCRCCKPTASIRSSSRNIPISIRNDHVNA